MKTIAAVELYKEGKVSIERASEIAGVNVVQFKEILSQKGIIRGIGTGEDELKRKTEELEKAKSNKYYVHIEGIIKGEELKCYTKLTENDKNNFVDGEMTKCEKRIGKLWLENDMLNKKYGMRLEDLCKLLDKMESEDRYEEKEIRGVSLLEAVSDTRRWKHIAEDLEMEEARYMKLMELKRNSNE